MQFAVIGSLLYALSAWFGGGGGPGNRIEIDRATIAHLESSFKDTWNRSPTPDERARLVEDHVREEIAYREAVALDLDRDDVIIRRRLRQKLEFLAEDTTGEAAPTDEQLSALLSRNADAYRSEPLVALRQVHFTTSSTGSLTDRWQDRLSRLQASGARADIEGIGEPSDLPQEWPLGPATEIRRAFGAQFTDTVMGLEPRRWHGPIPSGIGSHLVYVEEVRPGVLPELAAIRPLLEHDFTLEQRRRQLDDMYARLREKYPVVDATAAERAR